MNTDKTSLEKSNINRLPKKVRLLCMKHGCRLRFVKKYGGYICTKEGYCAVVRVLNLE